MSARIIFDLDGTLVESAPSLCRAGNIVLAELGRGPVDVDTYKTFVGRGIRVQVEELLRHTGGIPGNDVARFLARFRSIYEADPVAGTEMYPGVLKALRELVAKGHRIGVATQKPEAPAWGVLRGFGMGELVSSVCGGDTLGVLKPDPAMIRHVAAELGVGPVIFVGDSEVDAETAERAGVPFLLHLNGHRKGATDNIACAAAFDHFDALPGLVAELLRRAA